jgi:hypothetical protein
LENKARWSKVRSSGLLLFDSGLQVVSICCIDYYLGGQAENTAS